MSATRHINTAASALDAAIDQAERDLTWYRRNRWLGWADMERSTALLLRTLYRVRREAVRQHAAEQDRIRAAYFDLVEGARLGVAGGGFPLALTPDAGDHFRWPA